ncbi:lipopolysaccharide biosynthesis protein [Pontibacter sp. E15-1]|uniref:lipopolysaccharide biosynthesis protein n=1 Tax=Pontibacter sp. E15-1 TaxID=2919918 RepID=UPI001F503572|nr:lipopolysaccharide biosynthesis protein [Pontibacter sp. E15-1]MCJ8164120.1 lipopolysaccharide biosynthesis protein [Pontibacter sp. E15-1]
MAVASVKSQILSGLKWNSLSVFATRGTDFLVKLVLARLLLPEAFGVVGMAMVIIGFLGVVSDMGLFNALVQKKQDAQTDDRYATAFWLLLALATGFVISFFVFLSPLGASFYNEPKLIPILNALSIYLFFSISDIVPRVILTRQLNFKKLVRISISGTAVSSVIAVVLALSGFGVWSLVMKYLVSAVTVSASYWLNIGWKPRFVFRRELLVQMAGYSTYTQINSILFYFRHNLDYLIIGKLMSAHVLGVYTLAFTLSEVLRAQLYSIFNKVFFPIYSKVQDDREQIKNYYLKIMKLTAILTFPVSIISIGLAEDLILVFFGEKWLEAVAPLQILSVASMIFAISGTPAEVLKGIGKPSVGFYLNLLNTFVVAVPLIYLGMKHFGLVGVAFAVCIHYTTSRISYHYFMKKYIQVTNKEVFEALKPPLFAAAIMFSIIYCIKMLDLKPIFNILFAGTAGLLAYSLYLIGEFKLAFIQLKKR